MKSVHRALLAASLLVTGGCAGVTPVKDLALPPVTTIEGTVTGLVENGFTLADSSGSIYVRARLPGDKKLGLAVDQKVRVYGNLQGGQERVFDGYVIRKQTGEQIVVTRPTPHFGFIMQGSFE